MSLRFFGFHDCASEGKFLFEILAQLKGMGVGRYVTKSEWMLKWPDQPSYLRIIKARPKMDRWLQEGRLWADWTFRGKHLGIYEFDTNLNRSDWILVHKHDEAKLTEKKQEMGPLFIPDTFPLPPLQRLLSMKWATKSGVDVQTLKNRAHLDVSLDPHLEMYRPFIQRREPTRLSDSIYDEVDPAVYLDLYGKMLPFKVDSWSTDRSIEGYRFAPRKFDYSDENDL